MCIYCISWYIKHLCFEFEFLNCIHELFSRSIESIHLFCISKRNHVSSASTVHTLWILENEPYRQNSFKKSVQLYSCSIPNWLLLDLFLCLGCSPSTRRCLIEMTLDRTVEHVWGGGGKKTPQAAVELNILYSLWFGFGWRTNIDVRCKKKRSFNGSDMNRHWPQHPFFPLCSYDTFSCNKPSELDRRLVWLLSARSLSLLVWVCLNKLLWWRVPAENQFPGTRLFDPSVQIHALVHLWGSQTCRLKQTEHFKSCFSSISWLLAMTMNWLVSLKSIQMCPALYQGSKGDLIGSKSTPRNV